MVRQRRLPYAAVHIINPWYRVRRCFSVTEVVCGCLSTCVMDIAARTSRIHLSDVLLYRGHAGCSVASKMGYKSCSQSLWRSFRHHHHVSQQALWYWVQHFLSWSARFLRLKEFGYKGESRACSLCSMHQLFLSKP